MPSKKPILTIRTTEELIEKYRIISNKENRSISNKAETVLLDYLNTYEAEHGEIRIEEEGK